MDDACINITGSLNFKLVGRAWLKNKAEITSTYYAVRNREHCRANYHVFFTTSLYKNNLGVTRRRGSYVGTVIWFCKQKFNGANFFLAFAKLTNNPSTTQHSSLIPQVEKTKPSAQQKYAIILLNHDIKHQVGLVKQLSGNHRYSVIIPEGSFTVEELVDDGGKWSNV
ncbi:hypothetical protein V8B55DRAFT_1416446 [Mucor lusitanicus]|uniref:Uncharacterized protein n=2 Tax=Mucor circinelloides f. lusitanicus TaxID=29924 RepID=A0A168NFD6_MUCCL|nr:hypothetical protein FB192DRAFT_1344765 [Mucor lusitanicus]OAD06203.1 hypothetical protein MUCCIDRAFT_106768 [Mucor lusitanicus CBS 277.49]